MSRHPKPHRIPVLVLLALVFLLPALATAQPHHGEAIPGAAARHDVGPSLLAEFRSLLSILWQTGSILEPNGRPSTKPDTPASGDTGSGLDPDGRL